MPRRIPLLLLFSAALVAQPRQGPVNLDFSDSTVGYVPAGWIAPVANQGFPAVATDRCIKPGTHCGVVRSEPVASPGPFGNLMQYFDAAPYRNKRVRFRASVRVETEGAGRAQLWLRVDRPGQKMGFFDNMDSRPIRSREWQAYEINGEVSEDAAGIAVGMMLIGGQGAAYIDSVSFVITGEVQAPLVSERSRPLAGRGLENLTAYARLYGYVRHFHPSDQAFDADWEALAIAGVPVAESATDAADLARRLETFFRPVAPTVRVFAASAQAPVIDPGSGTKLIAWHHAGFGGAGAAGQRIYHSERIKSEAPDGKLPAPFLADLGGGVKALVPLKLFVDDQGTLPHAGAPNRNAAATRYTANDRAVRIADVIIAWNILQHFYPYFDVVHTDWPKALTTALAGAAADRDEDAFVVTLRRMEAALKDGHGHVSFTGYAAYAPLEWDWIENRLVVTYIPDAQGQPVERGDAVVAIDGKPVASALADAEALISGATPQWIRYRALGDLRLGPPDRPLVLEIEPFRNPAKHETVTLKRSRGELVSEPRPEKISELKPGIFYVDLTRLTDEDWKAALPRLEKAKGIVFDLRGYPGKMGPNWMTHLSDNAMTSAQWHVPSITEPDHRNMQFKRGGEWHLEPQKPYLAARRVVLTNGSAISYAESTMGIVEAYRLAEIVGSTTAGTNGNVNPITLPGGYHISWTGMKVLKHDGSQHHGVGIAPTIPVERSRAGVAAGKDEILERGLQALQ